MKFGKFIQGQQSEWPGSAFLDYKSLKKIFVHAPAADILHTKTAFFFKLDRELERVNTFYLQKEALARNHLRMLLEKKRILMIPSGSDLRLLLSIRDAFLHFQQDLSKLKNYVEVNQTGFRKILKKWDKKSKSSTKELYLSRQVEVQPCFNREILAHLTDTITTNLAELDSLIESVQDARPAPVLRSLSQIAGNNSNPGDIESDLIRAVARGDESLFLEFIETLKRDSSKDAIESASRLFYAVCDKNDSAARKLLETGLVDCNYANKVNGKCCLHELAIAGKTDHCRGVDMTVLDVYGRQPLHYAAKSSHAEFVSLILEYSDDPPAIIDSLDHERLSPLVHAIKGRNTDCAKLLIESGASMLPDADDGSSNSPLWLASSLGLDDIVTLLLQNDAADVLLSKSHGGGGLNAVHVACREGHARVVEKLISKYPSSLDMPDQFHSWIPIFFAAAYGNAECVRVLIGAGSRSADVTDEAGWTPLAYALYRGHVAVSELLEGETNDNSSAGNHRQTGEDYSTSKAEIESGISSGIPDLDEDGIPSFALPPPILPFRLYGHNYLAHSCYLEISFRRPDVEPISLIDSRKLSNLQLTISSKPENGIPFSIILPLEQNEQNEDLLPIFILPEEEADKFSVQFDIYPTFGTKVVGRAHALSRTLGLCGDSSGRRSCSVPLFDTQLKPVGQVNFDAFVVRPFSHPCLSIGGKVRTYWKSMALKDSHSPAAASVISGSSMIGEYAHAAVAVTADGVPIVSSNFWVPIEDSCVPVSSLTLAQLHRLGGFDNPGGEVKSLQDFVDISGGNKSRILTLKEALSLLPANVGLSLQVLFPTKYEHKKYTSSQVTRYDTRLNEYLDAILKVVYDHADTNDRSIIFSSTNPQVCTAINWKQPNYGVFFKTFAGFQSEHENDYRCSSVKEAIKFAKNGNFLGVFCYSRPLLRVPALIKTIKESGLILVAFGDGAHSIAGVDASISAGVLTYEEYVH